MNKDNGPVFRKLDLHVHTPESMCYGDKSVTPEQIIDAAVASGLNLIAITDHNTVAAIDGIRKAAEKSELCVLPGMELSTIGGHVIALFEKDTPIGELEDFLDYIGIAREGRGDAITMAHGSLVEVCEKIEERGGIAIAAHIERWPSGFLETNLTRKVKMGIHSSRYLSALELTVPQDRDLWNNGQVRGYPKKYACIQGSDAHALVDIGRRPVYVKMEKEGLAGLQAAFLDYENTIVFPDEYTPE